MKKNITSTLIMIVCATFIAKAQNLTFSVTLSTTAAASVTPLSLNKEQRDRFSGSTTDKIILTFTSTAAITTTTLRATGGPTVEITASQHTIDITGEIKAALDDKKENHRIDIENITNVAVNSLLFTWDKFTSQSTANKATIDNQKNTLDRLKLSIAFNNPYNHKKDRVSLFFDERGKLLNSLPVNVDANDYFYMYVVCPVKEENNYRINTLEGDFSPVDLSIRPFTKPITLAQATSENDKDFEPVTYTVTELRAGPFTSEHFKFQIAFDSTNGKVFNGPAYSMKINKLHHVGVGVSIIRSTLGSPDFRVAPLTAGGNTIEQYNEGDRTMLTFNVMWYWSVLHQKPKGNVVTSGRDILKDDPTFSLKRVFPTIGVTIDNKFSENFFAGFVYEFARGGSIIAGMHYGRVKQLADQNFVLGQDTFLGGDADIRTNKVYKPALFLGVNIDTRIFNTLFGRGE